jgi:DNA-binding IclR family transcriptional regulator
MSFLFNTKARRSAEDFKNRLLEIAEISKEKQEAIASTLGVSQSTVHSWLDPLTDRHMPAALIPLLPPQMATEIIQYLARLMEIRVNDRLNGRIEDEVTDLTEATGEFVHLYRQKASKAQIVAKAHEMQMIINQAIAEVESI